LRLGFKNQRLGALPKGGLWLHALSVGEALSALPIIQGLRQKLPARPIYISVATYPAWMMLRARLNQPNCHLLVRPLDVPWAVKAWLDALRPSFFCLLESDIWPGWQRAIKNRGIKSALLNLRVSSRAMKNYRRFPAFARKLYADFDLICAQSERDQARLAELGVKKVKVLGNIKYDSLPLPLNAAQKQVLREKLGLDGRRLLVAGSTHPGAGPGTSEGKICFQVWQRLRAEKFPDLTLLIAPRDYPRGGALLRLAPPGQAWLYSAGPLPQERTVLILDVVGHLSQVYALGEVAFVGGSLSHERGHNPLEPAMQGVPVLFGPDMDDFYSIAEDLQEIGAGETVAGAEEFYEKCAQLLANPEQARERGRRGRELCLNQRGAAQRMLAALPLDGIK
jgi:3-deoxy-D-manno-octulosonic-acid transferase